MEQLQDHPDETPVECYNLDGIPLTEINKAHTGISSPTLDSYDISTTSIARLGIRGGGSRGSATQNVQYEILVPQVERMLLPGTDITARVKTISGTLLIMVLLFLNLPSRTMVFSKILL